MNPQKFSEDKSLVPVKMRNEDPLSYYRSVFKKKKDIGETAYKKYSYRKCQEFNDKWINELVRNKEKKLAEAMTTANVFSYTATAEGETNLKTIDATDDGVYGDTTDTGTVLSGLNNAAVTSSGSGSGRSGGFDLGQDYLGFNGNGTPRWAILDPIDSRAYDTIVIKAIRGNDSNGGEDPDDTLEELQVWYQTPDTDEIRPLNQNTDGVTDTSIEKTIIPVGKDDSGLKEWSLYIPSYARAEDARFILYQAQHSGTGYDNYGVTDIYYQRRTNLQVIVSLDSPEATSFISVGQGSQKLSKEQRKKKTEEQLLASRGYTDEQFGKDFPGSEIAEPGAKIAEPPLGEYDVTQDKSFVQDYEEYKNKLEKKVKKEGQPGVKSFDDYLQDKEDSAQQVSDTRNIEYEKKERKEIEAKVQDIKQQQVEIANDIEQKEKEEVERIESEIENKERVDVERVELETKLSSKESEKLKDEGKSEEEIARIEQDKKEEVLSDKALEIDNSSENITYDREGFNNLIDILTGPLQAVLNLAGVLGDNKLTTGLGKINNSIAIFRGVTSGRITPFTPNSVEMNRFTNSITPSDFIDLGDKYKDLQSNMIGISDERVEYSDGNIYVKDGKVYENDGEYPDLTRDFQGLLEHGKGYAQMIIPKDGGEPYLHYYDYNYHNLNNPEDIGGGDVIQNFMKGASDVAHIINKNKTLSRLLPGLAYQLSNVESIIDGMANEEGLPGWPKGIHGAALTDFKVPLDKLPQKVQEMIKNHPLNWTRERISKMSENDLWDALKPLVPRQNAMEWWEDAYEEIKDKHPEFYKAYTELNKGLEEEKKLNKRRKEIASDPNLMHDRAHDAAFDDWKSLEDKLEDSLKPFEDIMDKKIEKAWAAEDKAVDEYNAFVEDNRGKKDPTGSLKRKGNSLYRKIEQARKNGKKEEDKIEKEYNDATRKIYTEYDAERKRIGDLVSGMLRSGDPNYGVDYTTLAGEVIPGRNTLRKQHLDPINNKIASLQTARKNHIDVMDDKERAVEEEILLNAKFKLFKKKYGGIPTESWSPDKKQEPKLVEPKPVDKPEGASDLGSVGEIGGVDATTAATLAGTRDKKKKTVTSSYTLQGSSLMEKKTLLKSPNEFFKVSDIKPEYPADPPPKMVNGWHPDFVSGDKISQRFNKLDPQSARAMPKTGNPKIDAKVAQAAQQPKDDREKKRLKNPKEMRKGLTLP